MRRVPRFVERSEQAVLYASLFYISQKTPSITLHKTTNTLLRPLRLLCALCV